MFHSAMLGLSMLFSIGQAVTGPDTLQNEYLRIVITPVTTNVRAGSLLELTDLSTGIDLTGGSHFGGIHSDTYIPRDGEIVCLSDTEAVFTSPGLYSRTGDEDLSISFSTVWKLSGKGLEITVNLETAEEAELWHPLEMDFYVSEYDSALFRNQSVPNDRIVDIHGMQETYRISGDQCVAFSGDSFPNALFVFPNPSKGILALNTTSGRTFDNYLSLRFFDVEPPRENCMGPYLHSELPEGSSSSYYIRYSLEDTFNPIYFSAHPFGYERTATWMMDEIPFIHPEQGDLWGFAVTSSDSERVTAQMIQLLEEHPNMKMNWLIIPDPILTPNRDSVWCEPGWEESWSHWHGTWRIPTMATQEYLEWLINIQENVYPWADRVTIGNHGYHHTPNADSSFGEFHEFITYEPCEHMERFRMTMDDITACGLDTSMIRVIRFPGHRTSLSGLNAIIMYGFEYYCNGIRWYEWMGPDPFYDLYISKYETPDGRIWGTNTVWWGDYFGSHPCEYLSTVLERGKHCLMGSHPINMLYPPEWPVPYDRIDSLCTSLENDYENFGWLFPIEYGEFLEDCYNINVTSIVSGLDELSICFSGSTQSGQWITAELPDEINLGNVVLDGLDAEWELRSNQRLFVDVSGLQADEHELLITWSSTMIEGAHNSIVQGAVIRTVNPSFENIYLTGTGFAGLEYTLSLFDLTGRQVLVRSIIPDTDGTFTFSAPWRDSSENILPFGVYCLSISGNGIDISTMLVRILR